MASSTDGDIRLSVGLDASSAKKSARDLQKDIQNTLDKVNNKNASTQMKSLATQMSNASTKAQSLLNDLEKLESTKLPTQEYQEIQKQIAEATKQVDKLIEKQIEMGDPSKLSKSNRAKFEKIDEQIEELGNTIRYAKGELRDLEETGKAFTLGSGTEKYSELTSRLGAVNNQMRVYASKMEDLEEKENRGTKTGIKFSDAVKRVASSATNAAKTIGGTLANAFTKLREKTKKSADSMGHMLKRLLMMSLGIRGTFMLIRKLRSAISDGLKSMSQFNNGNNKVNESMTALTSSLNYLKGAFGAAFAPILNVVTPILSQFIDMLAEAGNAIAMFFARLSGQTTVMQATKNTTDYAKSLDKTASSAKKATDATAKFDELNVINQNGGGGGGSSATQQYEEVEVQGFAAKLADFFKDASAFDIGKKISDTIADSLSKINWDKVFDKAKSFGKNLAEFLNGLINPRTFGIIGETLANVLNTVIYAALAFVTNFDWKNAGISFGTMINRFFETLDVIALAKTVSETIKGILTFAINFLKTTDFEMIGNKIGDFLANIDWKNILKKTAEAIWEGLKAAFDLLKGIYEADAIAGTIVAAIATAFTVAKFAPIVNKIASLFKSASATKAITTAGTSLGSTLAVAILGGVIGYALGDKIAEYLYGKEYTIKANVDVLLDYFSGNTAADQLSAGIQKAYADARSRLVNTKFSFNDMGMDIGAIYDDSKLAVQMDSLMQSMNNFQMQMALVGQDVHVLADDDAFEKWISGITGAFGELDPHVENALRQLHENYDSLSEYDKMLIDTTYGLKAYTDEEIQRIVANKDVAQSEKEKAQAERDAIIDRIKNNEALKSIYDKLPTSIKNNVSILQDFMEKSKENNGVVKETVDWIDKITGRYTTAGNAVNATKDAIAQYAREQGGYCAAVDTSIEKTDNLAQSLQDMGVTSDELSKYIDTLKDEDIPQLSEKATEMATILNEQLPTVVTTFKNFATDVKKYLGEVKKYWEGTFIPLFSADSLTEALKDVEPTFTTIFKGMANAVIGIVNRMIDSINDAFDISWDAVEVNGEKVVDAGSAQLIHINSIPALAQGAVLPPNKPFLAMLGDQSNGTNVEAPLSTIQEALVEALNDSAFINYLAEIARNTEETANKDLSVNIGDRDIARANARGQRSMGVSIINAY